MRILKLALPLALVCLIAAACSSDSDDSEPTAIATEAVSQPTEAAVEHQSTPIKVAIPLSAQQSELADAVYAVLLEDDERPLSITEDQIRCLADESSGVFSDARLIELGLSGGSISAVYEEKGALALGDAYELTEVEELELVNRALGCLDWRAFIAEALAFDGVPPERAECTAQELSDEGVRDVVRNLLVFQPGEDFGAAYSEILEAFETCSGGGGLIFDMLVSQGLSEDSARCVSDGMPEKLADMMMGRGEIEDDEEAAQLFGELFELQNRCLTPEELELMGATGFQASDPPESIGSGPCPPADGSGPTVLDFDGPQPLCLDPMKQYTAVFDTTAGEMRIALDMVNTPVTANNFAVLARWHYYDDTLLFRTDPGIGIIQGGSPHTNSPSDPGPGYTIPDEGWGFTYEPGQLVMARTAAPDSAGAQFFFAVNENTALLNSQGTYVVFGQMDEESLAVAEAILASHVDQPDNSLGGAPDPPVIVHSVTIEETG